MGQLFNRISRVVRAELNSPQGDHPDNSLNEGTALVAAGAATGASIGNAGILAGGTGYSLGAVPLAALGALTGAALYEALRSLLEGDASSAPAAAIGAAAGAATSATIGGVGVAIGGGAIGVGMASMAVGGAVVGLGLVGLHRLLQQGIDPETLLDSAIAQMQADAHKARQATISVISSQKLLKQQHVKIQAEVDKWQRRAQLALQKGDEALAKEALLRKKMHAGILSSLQDQLNQEPTSVKTLQKNLALLDAKLAEAKAMRYKLKEQIAVMRANGQLQSIGNRLGSNSAMSAFERMEEKVLQMEARSQAAAELAGADLESMFAALESGTDVDAALEAMKVQLLGTAQLSQAQVPGSEFSNAHPKDSTVEMELEELRRQIDQL